MTFGSSRRTAFQLTLVLGLVVMPLRIRYETIMPDRPFLMTEDANGLAGASWAGVRTGPDPMENRVAGLLVHPIQLDDHVGERGHEPMRHVGDRGAPHGL